MMRSIEPAARLRRAVRPLFLLLGLVLLLAGCGGSTPPDTTKPTADQGAGAPLTSAVTPVETPRFAAEPPGDWSGATISRAELPPEALVTLQLVAAGGPYPYEQDDGIFGNREALLPDRPSGTYREYTVETPGLSHRGARRLVIGDGRDAYWTDDHYESFRFVVP